MKVKTFYGEQPEAVSYYPSGDGVTVRFRENIEEVPAPSEDGGTVWQADEYSAFIRCGVEMARRRVEANFALWLALAKANAADPPPTPTERIQAQLEEQADALIELAEIICGGE